MNRATIVIALSLLVPGCGGDSILEQAEDGDIGRRNAAASLTRLERVPWDNAGPIDQNHFRVWHSFLTPCEPYVATAGGTVSPSRVRLVVNAGPGDNCDTGMAGMFGYEATITTPGEFETVPGRWIPIWAIHHYRDGRSSDSSEIAGVIYSPPPPFALPEVNVRGQLEPGNNTINPDLVVLYFETSAGDSSCTPSPRYQYGEYMGSAVSYRGEFAGRVHRWEPTSPIVCVVAYGYRDRQRVLLTPSAVRVDFQQPPTEVIINAILPAGPGSWERRWRP